MKRSRERRIARGAGNYQPTTAALLGAIEIVPVAPDSATDQAFFAHMRIERARELGLPAIAFTQAAVSFIAKRKITGERIGCMAVTSMPPSGKMLIEDFLVVRGRCGKLAAYAMFERLRTLKVPRVGFVLAGNDRMRAALEAIGMKITGYIMEG